MVLKLSMVIHTVKKKKKSWIYGALILPAVFTQKLQQNKI